MGREDLCVRFNTFSAQLDYLLASSFGDLPGDGNDRLEELKSDFLAGLEDLLEDDEPPPALKLLTT